jgi:hypothetical protein
MTTRAVFDMDRRASAELGAGRAFTAELLAGLAAMQADGLDLLEDPNGWRFIPGGFHILEQTPWEALAELGRRRLNRATPGGQG